MIDINNKKDCVGCNACQQVCPVNCISMEIDNQGFNYPKVDLQRCINCHLCEKVCPVIHRFDNHYPKAGYATCNSDQSIQAISSSGGVFFALAAQIIEDGGVVFGAAFNDVRNVVHTFAENLDSLKSFLGSKYVQSSIATSYKYTEKFLKENRKVLFSGTPCQIAGLKRYLRKEYAGLLICVDVVCHGVPSPMIWQDYLSHFIKEKRIKLNDIKYINFRDKTLSWENFGMGISYETSSGEEKYFETLTKNVYLRGFLSDLYLRPSCYQCPTKNGSSHSDITLADFWGIRREYPKLYKDGKHSLVLTNTDMGEQLLRQSGCSLSEINIKKALQRNPAYMVSAHEPSTYQQFWEEYPMKGIKGIASIVDSMQPSKFQLLLRKLGRAMKLIIRR